MSLSNARGHQPQIDALVYELYGLMEEEIEVVELKEIRRSLEELG